MGLFAQYRLLVWKNSLLLRRQKLRVVVEILWPLTLFFILAAVRTRPSLISNETECHFDSKPLPSAGIVPFMQGIVCSSANTCRANESVSEEAGQIGRLNNTLLERSLDDLAELVSNQSQRDILIEAAQEITELVYILRQARGNVSLVTNSSGADGALELVRQFLVVNETEFIEQLAALNVTLPPPGVVSAIFERTQVNTTRLVQAILAGSGVADGFNGSDVSGISVLQALINQNLNAGLGELGSPGGGASLPGINQTVIADLLQALQGGLNPFAGAGLPGSLSGLLAGLGGVGPAGVGLPSIPGLGGLFSGAGIPNPLPGGRRKKRQTIIDAVGAAETPPEIIDILEGGADNPILDSFCSLPENVNNTACLLRTINPDFGDFNVILLRSLICPDNGTVVNSTDMGNDTSMVIDPDALSGIIVFANESDRTLVTDYICSLSPNETIELITVILEDIDFQNVVSPRPDVLPDLSGVNFFKIVRITEYLETVSELPSIQRLMNDFMQFQNDSIETTFCGSDGGALGAGGVLGMLQNAVGGGAALAGGTAAGLMNDRANGLNSGSPPTILANTDNTSTPEQKKLANCQDMFMPSGISKPARIALSQFYPIVFGRIPYAPDTPVTRQIMEKAGALFETIEQLINTFSAASRALKPLTEIVRELGPTLRDLADGIDARTPMFGAIAGTQAVEDLLRQQGGSLPPQLGSIAAALALLNGLANGGNPVGLGGALNGLPGGLPGGIVPPGLLPGSGSTDAGLTDRLRALADMLSVGNSSVVSTLVLAQGSLDSVSGYLSCVQTDKFFPIATEEELVHLSKDLIENKTYWAAIVFEESSVAAGGDWKTTLPTHIKYKIRMNTDKVDGTTKIEDRTYSFGARSNPYTDLKYITFGFAYLQDMIERSLIELQTNDTTPLGLHLQQFPYPCYVNDQFNRNISRSMPLFLVLAWIFSVAMIVKGIVREKETRLKEVMKMMGMGNGVHWAAWFTSSYALISLSVICLCLLLWFGAILKYANMMIVLILLLVFAWATVCQAFLFSVFFTNANLAACCAALLYFVLYLPYTLLVSWEGRITESVKVGTSFFSSVAFGFACDYMSTYELTTDGLQWSNLWESPVVDDTFSVGKCLVIMAVDGFIYLLLVWYIEAVFPGKYGVPKKLYFPFTRSYWCGYTHTAADGLGSPGVAYNRPESRTTMSSETTEADPVDMTCGVEIQNLRKVYHAGGSLCNGQSEKVAVNGLSLNFYEDHITSFLGHNGAGKTTTMSVLSGLFPPTSGTALVYGRDIRTDMDAIRRNLGICPQFNVLFDSLTVEEHILFYAAIKGMGTKDAKKEMEGMLKEVGLLHKKKEFSRNLSGGMKRKLSVMAAFVGGSRCVILDEPTAGVDPYSRRQIWELLLRFKKGRTVLLSTHHMDEADFLGDRIAIISQGQLRCVGSSLFLKAKYGSGYYLTVEMKKKVEGAVGGVAENKEVRKKVHYPATVGTVGAPPVEDGISGLAKAQEVAAAAAGILDVDDSPGGLLEFVSSHVPGAILEISSQSELVFVLPSRGAHDGSFIALFNAMDALQSSPTFQSSFIYGVSDTTLEEVFIRVADEAGVDALSSLTDAGSLPQSRRARLLASSRRHLDRVRRKVKSGLSSTQLPCMKGSAEGGNEEDSGGDGRYHLLDVDMNTLERASWHAPPLASPEDATTPSLPPYEEFAASRPTAPPPEINEKPPLDDTTYDYSLNMNTLQSDSIMTGDLTSIPIGDRSNENTANVHLERFGLTTHDDVLANRHTDRSMNRPHESDTEGETDGETTEGSVRFGRDTLSPNDEFDPQVSTERVTGRRLYMQQFKAMFVKRFHNVRRSAKAFVCEILLPGAFVCFALSMALIVPPVQDSPPLEVHPYHYELKGSSGRLRTFYSNEKPEHEFTQQYESLMRKGLYGTRCMDPSVYEIDGYPCNNGMSLELEPSYSTSPVVGNLSDCDCSSGFQHCPEGAAGPDPSLTVLPTEEIIWNMTSRNITDYLSKRRIELRKRVFGGLSLDVIGTIPNLNESNLLVVLNALYPLLNLNTSNAEVLPGSGVLFPNNSTTPASPVNSNFTEEDVQTIAAGLEALIESVNIRQNIKVWFNNKGWLSSVAFLNSANNAVLRSRLANGSASTANMRRYGLSLVNHPMELTDDQLLEAIGRRAFISVLISICIIFAMSLIPATFILYLIDDRVSTSKHLQLVSGLDRAAYWGSNYVWDCLNYCLASAVVIFLFLAFNEQAYVSSINAPALIALLIFYGLAMIPLMYPFSFVFAVPSTAYVVLSCLNIFLGFTTTIASFILESLGEDEELKNISIILKQVFLIFPHYCLGRGLIDIATRHVEKELRTTYLDSSFDYNPFDWDIIGRNLLAMVVSAVGYFCIVLLIEYGAFTRISCFFNQDYVKKMDDCDDEEDVDAEKIRVKSGQTQDDVLVVDGLTKVYRTATGKYHGAVKKLFLGVKKGECFGLLGVNGAGKTTTFKMLTGDVSVTAGDARLRTYSILTQMPQVQRSLGYCPQFDALDALLTAREHLEFYARLRGITPEEVKPTAQRCLVTLGLRQYADKLAGDLSGGNKRKLQAAIALIGGPEIIFLDEPTTGMDPKARRFLWTCVRRLVRAGQAVVLTSHSMEECEALCTRLAIMVNGRFRCLGGPQHLKNKYGNGYSIKIRSGRDDPESVEELKRAMCNTFGCRDSPRHTPADGDNDNKSVRSSGDNGGKQDVDSVMLMEENRGVLQYQAGPGLSLVNMFMGLESVSQKCDVDDYSVNQTNLDQVFISFASEQTDEVDGKDRGKADSGSPPVISSEPNRPRSGDGRRQRRVSPVPPAPSRSASEDSSVIPDGEQTPRAVVVNMNNLTGQVTPDFTVGGGGSEAGAPARSLEIATGFVAPDSESVSSGNLSASSSTCNLLANY